MGHKKISDQKHRPQISKRQLIVSADDVLDELKKRLNEKGAGAWLSKHEILGFATEEYTELVEAVHQGNLQDVRSELVDLAAGCLFGILCMDSGTLDW